MALGRLRRENKERRICHPREARSEIRFVRAIDQNKPSSLGTATTATAVAAEVAEAEAEAAAAATAALYPGRFDELTPT